MSKTLVKMPIDATHSDGDKVVLIRVNMVNDKTYEDDIYINLGLKQALLFQQALATAINDEFGHFNSVAT